MNIHEGHEATCFCCTLLQISEDYGMEWTPGDGVELACRAGKFCHYNPGEAEYHTAIQQARECGAFDPRKSELTI